MKFFSELRIRNETFARTSAKYMKAFDTKKEVLDLITE